MASAPLTQRLIGKTVLVTGSTRGIGRSMVERFAAEGAGVVVTGRSEAAGREVEELVRSAGGDAVFARCDVTNEGDIEEAVSVAVQRWGKLDGLVANAADLALNASDGPVTELSLDVWESMLRSDLTSVFLTLKYGIGAMCQGAGGSVVTIASLAALRGVNGSDAYSAAKGGVVSLTRTVASYYARYDVRCNCIASSFVNSGTQLVSTAMTNQEYMEDVYARHLGRIGQPEDIANVALFLLSDEAAYLTGAVLSVDGGVSAVGHLKRVNYPDIQRYERKRALAPQV
jgi:NAD(P)-dependent dehydrogenase (short-subunit alcohol dehydrogenase family)